MFVRSDAHNFLRYGIVIVARALALLLAVAPSLYAQRASGVEARIGKVNGADLEVFADIVDLDVDSDGRVFVLDQQNRDLTWFDADARALSAVGREGGGPGEFEHPIAVEAALGKVYVLDSRHNRITKFSADGGRLAYVDDVRLPLHATDFCVLDGSLFVLAYRGDGILHEVDANGTVVKSFGAPEAPSRGVLRRVGRGVELLKETWNRGELACDEASGIMVVLFDQIPVIRAFSRSGKMLWRTIIDPYISIEWLGSVDPRGIRMALNPERKMANNGVALAIGSNSTVSATLSEVRVTDGAVAVSLERRTFALATGQALDREKSTARVAAIRDGRWYGYINEPFPQVVIGSQ